MIKISDDDLYFLRLLHDLGNETCSADNLKYSCLNSLIKSCKDLIKHTIIYSGSLLGTWFFKTAPEDPVEGMTFVTGGDMFHTREMLNSMNQRAGTEEPLFALLGGDLALADGAKADRWLDWVQSWGQYAVSPSGLSIKITPFPLRQK